MSDMNEQELFDLDDLVVVLIDEDDVEHSFIIIENITVDGLNYAVLEPLNEDEREEDSAIVLKVVEEDGEELMFDIEDDEEWERVVNYWNQLVDEEA